MCRVCIDHYQGHPVIAPITLREWGETDASAKLCASETSLPSEIHLKAQTQMTAASEFPCKLPWKVISNEHVNNIITALHLTLYQVFNKSIIRRVFSLWQSVDPQMAFQQTAHSLFTDAFCTHEKQEGLIWLAGTTNLLWKKKSAFKVPGWGRICFPGCHFFLYLNNDILYI